MKYDVVEQLASLAASAGCSLPELAIAFPLTHPAVTSVITRPRTIQQLEQALDGASRTLDDATLDQIDKIVPPGTDLYAVNAAWTPRALTDPALRRRPAAARAASGRSRKPAASMVLGQCDGQVTFGSRPAAADPPRPAATPGTARSRGSHSSQRAH